MEELTLQRFKQAAEAQGIEFTQEVQDRLTQYLEHNRKLIEENNKAYTEKKEDLSFVEKVAVMQLRNLYNSWHILDWEKGTTSDYCPHLHVLYDYLKYFLDKEGVEFVADRERKKQLYATAKKKFVKENQPWIKKLGKCEFNDRKLEEVYKSLLVREFIMETWRLTDVKIKIVDGNGKEIKPIVLAVERMPSANIMNIKVSEEIDKLNATLARPV